MNFKWEKNYQIFLSEFFFVKEEVYVEKMIQQKEKKKTQKERIKGNKNK